MATWFLNEDGKPESRETSGVELIAARGTAYGRLECDPTDYEVRSCWVCNPAHSHFLDNLTDGFLFACLMGCGRWYYQGIDITEDSLDEQN
jgi:hypothetical protein